MGYARIVSGIITEMYWKLKAIYMTDKVIACVWSSWHEE